jgi:transposase
VQAEIARLRALRPARAPEATGTVPASDLIIDLGRAAERLRAQAAETVPESAAMPSRRQWWRWSWWRRRARRDAAGA